MKLSRYSPILIASLTLVSCVDNGGNGGKSVPGGGGGPGGVGPLNGCEALDTLQLGPSALEIVDLDASNLSPIVTDLFDRYAAVVTPSGNRIHLVAQAGVSDAKIRRAREIMRMHLQDVAGTGAGASKADVANAISGTCGTIAMFSNQAAYDLALAEVARFDTDFGAAYVPLFGDQVIVEGTGPYLAANPAYDQTFGATSVLAYRLGLSTERPAWAADLRLALNNALADGTFEPNGFEPYRNLEEAFLGVTFESHSGIWGHDPNGNGSAQNGVYDFGSRPAMAAGDASTLDLLEDFFSTSHDFPAEIDPNFSGNFDLLFNQNLGYSNRTQYLGNVFLTGSNSAEIFGNSVENGLTGNAGNNNLNGRSGDDILDGGPGLDTAVFFAPREEFTIINNGDGTLNVRHDVQPGLGNDLVRNIEILLFSNETVQL